MPAPLARGLDVDEQLVDRALARSRAAGRCLVAKWLKKVFCATSARSQISATFVARDAALVEERDGGLEHAAAQLELAALAAVEIGDDFCHRPRTLHPLTPDCKNAVACN